MQERTSDQSDGSDQSENIQERERTSDPSDQSDQSENTHY